MQAIQARQGNANHRKASKAMHAKQSTTMKRNANQSKASNANFKLGSRWDNYEHGAGGKAAEKRERERERTDRER